MADDYVFTQDDIAGDCFVAGSEGEKEEEITANEVWFPHTAPVGPVDQPGTQVLFNPVEIHGFIWVNYEHLVAAGIERRVAVKIAYIRFLAARHNLMNPGFDTAGHHVRYNDAKRLTEADTLAAQQRSRGEGAVNFEADMKSELTVEWKKRTRLQFVDLVCSVAYVFRVRGHHWRPDLQDRYVSLWANCLHNQQDMPVPWVNVATHGLHAIMPDVLDEFWANCCNAEKCAGTLIKRWNSAPAGVAGVYALKKGLDDVLTIFPGVQTRIPESFQRFNELYARVTRERWGGSINSRYYGAPRIRVNDDEIGALASVVKSMYSRLSPESRLNDSPALARLAELAPVTGASIGMAAGRTIANERFTLIESE
jgi:hypothetical protein